MKWYDQEMLTDREWMDWLDRHPDAAEPPFTPKSGGLERARIVRETFPRDKFEKLTPAVHSELTNYINWQNDVSDYQLKLQLKLI